MKKRFAFVLVIITVCSFMAGCGKNSSNIFYSNVAYDKLDMLEVDSTLITDDNTYAKLFRDYTNANTTLNDIGVSAGTLSVYDEDYFKENILLAVVFAANSEYEYSVKNLKLGDNTLTVNIDEQIPEQHTLLKIYRVILIDVPKDNLPEDAEVKVEINSNVGK